MATVTVTRSARPAGTRPAPTLAQTTWGSPVCSAGFTPAGQGGAREARPHGRASRPGLPAPTG